MRTDPGYFAVMTLVTLLLLLPLLLVEYPPFVDYPNHLARAFVRAHYHQIPILERTYQVSNHPAPYLGLDLIVAPLAAVLEVKQAGKVFIGLMIIVFCLGCHVLGQSIQGRPSWAAPVACFWVYNSATLWGFLNYVLSVAVFMIALGCWLRWQSKWSAVRYFVFASLALAAYLAHFAGYMALGLSMVAIASAELMRGRLRLATAVGSILPATLPIALFFMWSGTGNGADNIEIVWNTIIGKVAAILVVIRTYSARLDTVLTLAWLLLAAAAAVFSRRARVVWPVAFAGVVLIGVFLASPLALEANGTGISSFDSRFFLPGILLLLFAAKPNLTGRRGAAVFALAMTLSLFRLTVLTAEWRPMSVKIAAATELFGFLPEGARVYPAFFPRGDFDQTKRDWSFKHVLSYAVPDRKIIDPGFFQTGRLVTFRDPPALHGWRPGAGAEVFNSYQFVWSYGEPEQLRRLIEREAEPLGQRGGFTLWKLTDQ